MKFLFFFYNHSLFHYFNTFTHLNLKIMLKKNNKKTINAWCSFDAANSVYNLIITSVLFPIYYKQVTQRAFGGDMVSIFGLSFKNTVLYDFTIAIGYAIVIFLTPLLSGIADMGGYRKRFMIFFTIIGATACSSLYFFNGYNMEFGLILIALAVVGWAGSFVYYNSFLPIIATPDRHNSISAKGFAWGYMGSMILFLLNIITIETWQIWGFPNKLEALRFSFLLVGIWWIAMAQIAFFNLKEYKGEFTFKTHLFAKGFQEIAKVFRNVIHMKTMNLFLVSFFFLSMGVQTVMLVAALFGSSELGIGDSELIITVFLIQILAVVGSFTFAKVSNTLGNFVSLLIMLGIWVVICTIAYYVQTANQFYILAAMVGLVMGGIQSQARATYSKLIPNDTIDTASYFSFYDITEKIGIVLGMFSFGLLEHITGNMRISIVMLSIYFVFAFLILLYALIKKKQVVTS